MGRSESLGASARISEKCSAMRRISRRAVSAEPLASAHLHLSNRLVTLIAESEGSPLIDGGIVNRARLTWPVCGEFHITRRPESETSPCSGDASDMSRVARAEARVRRSVVRASLRPARCDTDVGCKTSCNPRASVRDLSAAKTRFDPNTRAE